ncbi:MAG: endonuclease III [Bacteroidales bacterium]|nr:endonuclease III [Bacteroidales bacterium]
MTRKKLFDFVVRYFSETMPKAETELHYSDAFSLLVAVMLSAQCTDKRVNMVTPALLQRFPSAADMAQGSVDEILALISSVSYPNSKARHLSEMSRLLVDRFNGEVPSDFDSLVTLPGVGRKTANVMISVFFHQQAIAVDTHVFRVSARIGLSVGATTPLQTEQQLTAGFPHDLLATAHHWLILHGRYVCTARKPHCEDCGLTGVCLHFKNNI